MVILVTFVMNTPSRNTVKNISAALMCEQADIGTYPFNTLPSYSLHLNFDMVFWKAFSVGIMRNYAMGIFYQPSSKTRMSLLFFR